MTYTYGNSGYGNDGKVNYVPDNKIPQQGKLYNLERNGTEAIGGCTSFKLPYSIKLWWEKTLADLAVHCQAAKVLSTKTL